MKNKSRAKRPEAANGGAQKRLKILQSVLPQVPFDGWTESAYGRGLKLAGVTRGEADLLFPQGLRDVIGLFGEEADRAMLAKIEREPGFQRLKVREKIALAVRTRLESWQPHREAVRRMMYWYALPFNLPLGMKRLYKTVDLMWRAAGDASTDFNFYTKRGLLAAVLKATILFWLDDKSAGCEASWQFLDRRISDVLKAGKSISLPKEFKPNELMDMVKQKLRRT